MFLDSFQLDPNIIFSSMLQNTLCFVLFLKHATNKADNIHVPGCTPTRVLQSESEQNNERFIYKCVNL
jgi:hypothetical protein